MKKIALLGFDSQTTDICQCIHEQPDAEVSVIVAVSPREAEQLLRIAPGAELLDWEDLLADERTDAVVVAGGDDWLERADQLTRLSTSNKALLIQTPICESLKAVELQLNCEDGSQYVAPVLTDARWTHWTHLAEWIADSSVSPVGEVQQIVLQRELTDSFRQHPLPCIGNDIALLERLLGRFDRVSALSTSSDADDWQGTTVSLIGESKVVAQWTNSTGSGDSMLVLGRDGQAVFRWNEKDDSCSLERGDDVQILGENLRSAFLSQSVQDFIAERHSESSPSWHDLCRCLEIADVVERSRRRGRTIELHQEERSEESSFKGVMATGSCLILMFGFLLLLVFSLVEGMRLPFARNEYERQRQEARDAGRPVPNVQRTHILLRLWPFYPFAIFLLLQLFRLVVPSRKTESHEADS